ncbi:MAG: septal ring lytic transglycosylase RlpA family protein [Alphaproteobacteria bacterium]|nr:septal ring lytic transglycosylase RlpA family protein [Alphaproteobacteria bacterium]
MVLLFAGFWLLSGCSETKLMSHWVKKVVWPGQLESRSAYKIGDSYKIDGVRYYPKEEFTLVETGIASWYGPGFHKERTANGEIFDQNELTAAHRTLQLPSIVRVTNLENGRSVVVRVNDRGPFKHGRVLDASKRTAELLGFKGKGTARVRLKVLERESRVLAEAAKNGEDTTRLTLTELRKNASGKVSPVVLQPIKVASPSTNIDELPESLLTPTITVDELISSKRGWNSAPSNRMAEGHIDKGRFMPDPVVTKAPVNPTGIFVQAGSFAVFDNAERLTKRLVKIAPTVIEPVTIKSRKMYRVKLGPLASVEEADKVLEKVIQTGQTNARIVKNKR